MIYFFSDVHLGHENEEKNKQVEDLLINFLRKAATDCKKLIILGDLFDYWFEYKTVIPRIYTRTLAQLLRMRESGIEIYYIIGNHDFGHIDFFEKDMGMVLFKDDTEMTFSGKKFFLSHGDGKLYNDKGYEILKKILRNPLAQWLYRQIHPDWGIGLASGSSRKSRNYTSRKNQGRRDGLRDFAIKKIDEGYDYVLMGHTHNAEKIDHSRGIYINTGCFFRDPTFARFDGKDLYLEKVDDFLAES